MSDFDESKHPRDGSGKFTDGNGQSQKTVDAIRKYSDDPARDMEYGNLPSAKRIADGVPQSAWESQKAYDNDDPPLFGSQEELDALLGEEFEGVKGQAAVDKLLKEKRGHVKGAFHRDDIGDIDLFWGNEYVGLRHIIEERQKEKAGHVDEALTHLETAIEKAEFDKINDRGNLQFIYKEDENKFFVIIAPEYHKKKLTYVVTTFKRSPKRPKNKSTE